MTKTAETDVEKEVCGACGEEFDTLAEVFSHECNDTTAAKATLSRPASPLARGPKATDKQVAFLIRLGVDEAEAHQMSKSTASETIDKLLKSQGAPPMSEKQEGFLRSLLARKQPDADADGVITTLNATDAPARMASAMIDTLKALQDVPKAKVGPELIKGDVHVVAGEFYRVHLSQGSGNFYACRWDGTRFEYKQGAIKLLDPSNKITAEQAAQFGEMFQRCCFCSAALDTPESTAVGYGPKCAAKHGLPWG